MYVNPDCLDWSPSTLCSSGVMVAHLIPTLYFLIASAQSTVTGRKGKRSYSEDYGRHRQCQPRPQTNRTFVHRVCVCLDSDYMTNGKHEYLHTSPHVSGWSTRNFY